MRHKLVLHSILFVSGFTLIFVLAAILLQTAFASASIQAQQYLAYVGGIIIIVFGAYLTGLLRIPFLQQERRVQATKSKYAYISSFLFGVAFAAGWSPCIGAILGAILTLAAISPASAFWLLLAYSLGIGVPFILVGVLADAFTDTLRKFNKHLRAVQIVFGVLLILLGVLILSNGMLHLAEFTAASNLFVNIDSALANQGVGILVSFIAGTVTFLSPCVFPLVPAYLAYLGGLSVKPNK
ncbi:MAG: cytochrome c biogenesis protein CcdA [Candidatus Woesearchaeota archaeon]